MALLAVNDVSKTYRSGSREVCALDGISLSVDTGEFVAVQGPSGCGKTTLLLITGGLLAPDEGDVEIDGQNPYNLPSDERARFRAENVGFVFQQFHLIPYLSVLENVLAPAIASGETDAQDRAHALVRHFSMEHRIRHVPGELSTGERQRTALARALLNRPKLLLADEPTGNLDRENADAVLGYLKEFVAAGGGVLLVTHDSHAVEFAQRVTDIRDGQLAPA